LHVLFKQLVGATKVPTTTAPTETTTRSNGNPYPPKVLRGIIFDEGNKGYKTEAELFDRIVARANGKGGYEKATRAQVERCYKLVCNPPARFNDGRSKVEKTADGLKIVPAN